MDWEYIFVSSSFCNEEFCESTRFCFADTKVSFWMLVDVLVELEEHPKKMREKVKQRMLLIEKKFFITDLETNIIKFLKQKNPSSSARRILKSGWQDSNLRPPGPKPGAMTGLRYIPNYPKVIFLSPF